MDEARTGVFHCESYPRGMPMGMTDKYDAGIECPNGHHGVVTWEEVEQPVGHVDKEITLSDVSSGFTLMDWKTRTVRCERCGVMFQIK